MTPVGAVVRVSLAGVLAASCVKVPPFQPHDAALEDADDGGTEPGAISVTHDSATGVLVTGPGYTIRFSTEGALFPHAFDVGGESMLGDSEQCGDEQGMGVVVRTMFRANGDSHPRVGEAQNDVRLAGPHVGQVRVNWSGSTVCEGVDRQFTGESTFSFFPDGRLTRFDVIHTPSLVDSVECARCDNGAASTFWLGSYTTLAIDPDAEIDDAANDLVSYDDQSSPGQSTCVRQRQQSIAFAWDDLQKAHLRLVRTAPQRSIAFSRKLYEGALLEQARLHATTQMAVSSSESCDALEERILPFVQNDRKLIINGTPVGAATNDGIFGDDQGGFAVEFPVQLVGTSMTSATVPIPAGFAVWLTSTTIPQQLVLSHTGGHTGTSWYRLQRVGDNDLVVWFDVPLGEGEAITIGGT